MKHVPIDNVGPAFGEPIGPWHRVLAWYPVHTFDGGWKWLQMVWRRRYQKKYYLDGPDMRWWAYRYFENIN